MKVAIIEATQSVEQGPNHGKFLVGEFDSEWEVESVIEHRPLVAGRGWTREHRLVMDLQTGEGAIFKPGGASDYDLDQKHRIWVCPLFAPFLAWLYEQPLPIDVDALPAVVELPNAPASLYGHRRDGADIEEPA